MDKNYILRSIAEIDSSFMVNSAGMNKIKDLIAELTGELISFCDIAVMGNGEKQYILKTKDDVFRASIHNKMLTIKSDNNGGNVIHTFEIN